MQVFSLCLKYLLGSGIDCRSVYNNVSSNRQDTFGSYPHLNFAYDWMVLLLSEINETFFFDLIILEIFYSSCSARAARLQKIHYFIDICSHFLYTRFIHTHGPSIYPNLKFSQHPINTIREIPSLALHALQIKS